MEFIAGVLVGLGVGVAGGFTVVSWLDGRLFDRLFAVAEQIQSTNERLVTMQLGARKED